jgi:hypothetical protein
MKNFSFSPLIMALAIASVLAGCAATPAQQNEAGKTPMTMGMCSPDKDKAGQCGCPYCNMNMGVMSSGMKDKPMGMMHEGMSPQGGSMCMSGGGDTGKGGCACCGMDAKSMSPEMHKKHMEMMQQHHPHMMQDKMPPKPAVK